MDAPDDYKARKEAFVSNLSGGSLTEINTVLAIAPLAYLLWAALQSRIRLFQPYNAGLVALDTFINCGALLLAVTVYSDQPVLLNLLFASPAVLICLLNPLSSKKLSKPKNASHVRSETTLMSELPKKSFLTVYRGTMMVITCIAILAVDFKVFPRRFAKVENWGTSIMDLGVGSFVFSGGLVAARTIVKQYMAQSGVTFQHRMKTAMRSAIPLLVLGFVRLAMVKGVDYAEHVTEYGVHWNFFFTLGLIGPFVALLQTISSSTKGRPMILYTCLSLTVGIVYQIVLNTTGLQEYILVGDRHKYGIFGMNKEGFSSFFGYLSIFLAGISTGTYVLPKDSSTRPKESKMLKLLGVWFVFWTAAYMACTEYWGFKMSVSRRVANLPYVFWVASFNTGQLMAFYLVERTFFSARVTGGMTEKETYSFSTPWVLEAFNRNGLAIFLVSNLCTGVVNLSVQTLDTPRVPAMAILASYVGILALLAIILDHFNISVKL
ncbi:GPI-anchored wall transfer protein 1 [Ascodesmis nigricans]|uniref:GPI-anchored wall transfer protein n=1 Tax=Ascodesmis nigricans TaxID=341454 RepID=A0A4S2N829_9PEZI|nr:GPI-anchored wall transfer protein 1 [Ascodesmis nigricans]